MTSLTTELQTVGFIFSGLVVTFGVVVAWGAAKLRGDVF